MKRLSALATCLLLACQLLAPATADCSNGVDLSPASWPNNDLERYTRLNLRGSSNKPRAEGRQGMVVGTTGALAVRAGLEALRQGGSATDAALVTALTQVTLAAGSWVSFAGILTLVHYNAATGKLRYLNGEFNTVLGEDDPLSIPAAEPSGRTAMVPGFMAAVEAAHRRLGVLPFESLFEPAIYFAEEGFRLDRDLAGVISFRSRVLSRRPETRAIFFKADGSLYQAGETFRQPQLAETLSRVAERGASYMYTGDWGQNLVEALQSEGGKMTIEDLRRYRVLWRKPKRVRYGPFRVWAPAAPGAGGRLAARAFASLNRVNLPRLGHYTESADALFELMHATRRVYDLVPPLNHSDGVIAADSAGNVVALLHSINTAAWGTTGIFVDGVSIPDSAASQQRRIRDAGPGKRIWSGTNPMIVTRKRRPVLASSAIGRGLFEASIQSIVNVLDYDLDPKQATSTAMFRAPRRLADGTIGEQLVTRGDFPPDLLQAVRNMGIPIGEQSRIDFEGMGYWIGVSLDPQNGLLVGATTDSFNGRAEGF